MNSEEDQATNQIKMGDSGGAEEQLPTISDDLVVTKYKMAAEIVNGKQQRAHALLAPLPRNNAVVGLTRIRGSWGPNLSRLGTPWPLLLCDLDQTSFVRQRMFSSIGKRSLSKVMNG